MRNSTTFTPVRMRAVEWHSDKEFWDFLINKALQFKSDFAVMPFTNLQEVYNYALKNYKIVKGEQVIRPIHFYEIGGDCDNQVVFILGFLAYSGYNLCNVRIVDQVFHDSNIRHIFLQIRASDSLPWTDLNPMPGVHASPEEIKYEDYYTVCDSL